MLYQIITTKKSYIMKASKFPFTFKVTVFSNEDDKRDLFLAKYFYETTVTNENEERKFYESFDGNENVIINII